MNRYDRILLGILLGGLLWLITINLARAAPVAPPIVTLSSGPSNVGIMTDRDVLLFVESMSITRTIPLAVGQSYVGVDPAPEEYYKAVQSFEFPADTQIEGSALGWKREGQKFVRQISSTSACDQWGPTFSFKLDVTAPGATYYRLSLQSWPAEPKNRVFVLGYAPGAATSYRPYQGWIGQLDGSSYRVAGDNAYYATLWSSNGGGYYPLATSWVQTPSCYLQLDSIDPLRPNPGERTCANGSNFGEPNDFLSQSVAFTFPNGGVWLVSRDNPLYSVEWTNSRICFIMPKDFPHNETLQMQVVVGSLASNSLAIQMADWPFKVSLPFMVKN